ncbi:MAG: hypothetical protein GX389_04505 [Clostridiaceae bacterium]|jgi:stage III sporulation protein AG|nr:hypothetical protein [Clostridiaceae bacterium]
MFKNITGFFVKKKDKTEKRKLSLTESIIIMIALGIIIILAGSYIASSNKNEDTLGYVNSSSANLPVQKSSSISTYDGHDIVADIEERLADLLSKVEGAGEVSVMVYADTGSEMVPAYNNEQDTRNDEKTDGRTTEISENRQLALSGKDEPVILKVIIPQIKGVVVVAEGADDILIKAQLNEAVCTLLGIPEHRVQILKHK